MLMAKVHPLLFLADTSSELHSVGESTLDCYYSECICLRQLWPKPGLLIALSGGMTIDYHAAISPLSVSGKESRFAHSIRRASGTQSLAQLVRIRSRHPDQPI